MNFLLVKVLHIISIICWMAGLLYLPRLFVYHAIHLKNEETHNVFCTMQDKLIKIIMNPSMVFTVISGIIMLHLEPSYLYFWWMHVKLVCIVLLIITHRYFVALHRAFLENNNQKDHKFFRQINELPTVLMIIIVTLIVLKP